MRRSLSLRKSTVVELTTDELAIVAGAGPTFDLCILTVVTIEPNWTQVTW